MRDPLIAKEHTVRPLPSTIHPCTRPIAPGRSMTSVCPLIQAEAPAISAGGIEGRAETSIAQVYLVALAPASSYPYEELERGRGLIIRRLRPSVWNSRQQEERKGGSRSA